MPTTPHSLDPSPRTSLTYASLQLLIAYVTLAIVNYVPAFYASEVGIPMLAISALMLLSRGLDVITDPLIGFLSDRTSSRLGRRKPWILAGAPVLLLGCWLLFLPPDHAGKLYFLAGISILFLGLTMVQLPYVAWGAELASSYDGRTRVTSLRERVGALGSICALLTAFVVARAGHENLRPVLEVMTWVIFLCLPPLILLAVRRVPAGHPHIGEHVPFFHGAMIAFRNRSFRLFALAILLLYIGITPGGAVGWFLFDHYFSRPDLYAPSLLLEFIASFIGLPVWTAIAVRTSKHRALSYALLWIALFTAVIPLMAAFGVWGIIVTITLRSLALGALLMLPMAIIADVIDLDAATTGTQRTGVYMAFGGIVVKFAITVGVAAALAIPGLFGFDATSHANSDTALFSVIGTYSWMPGLFFLAAVPLFWRFPLDRSELAKAQAALD
ncbi:MFS transporter [Pseudohalioglobus sediminis]|uniref:MFS transporter n=1 Tax=Pseudohalioglobus sediminis TaxID=2606449 RepID=UPI00165FA65F|nr:MFS transporter [Pseudohalioglobus sediminis]